MNWTALRQSAALLAVCIALIGGGTLSAGPYNVANDFSATNNPNGVWSYGHDTGTLGSNPDPTTFTLFPSVIQNIASTTNDLWDTGSCCDPNVIHNHSLTNAVTLGDQTWAPNEVSFGPFQGPTVIRFTAPTAGQYTIDATFRNDIQAGNTTPDVYVYQNATQLLDENTIAGVTGSKGVPYNPFSQVVTLAKGDTIDFIAWGNNNNNKTVGIDATITSANAVPEPASLTLLGLGGIALAGAARRRRMA